MSYQPKRVSNELDDFVKGGLYPGGTGIIQDIYYTLWDYNGSMPPQSQMCVECIFQPTDGGNEGKPVTINWNVGSAKDFQPDPAHKGFALSQAPASEAFRDSSNWHFVLEKLRDNCGMEKGRLAGADGIRALIGSEATFTRMDPPKREGLLPRPGDDPNKPVRVNQILVPTKCRFAWEKGGKARATASAAASAPATTAATVSAPASASNGSGSDELVTAVKAVLAANDSAIEVDKLPALVTDQLNLLGVKAAPRVRLLKTIKEPEALSAFAAANGLTLEEGVLSQ